MTKPWDNEPTFNTDKNATKWGNYRKGEFIDADFTRDLERRLRHAEKLLEMDYMCQHCMYDSENIRMKKLRIVHLETARQEDGR